MTAQRQEDSQNKFRFIHIILKNVRKTKKQQQEMKFPKRTKITTNTQNNQKLTIQKTLTEAKKSEKQKIKMNTET